MISVLWPVTFALITFIAFERPSPSGVCLERTRCKYRNWLRRFQPVMNLRTLTSLISIFFFVHYGRVELLNGATLGAAIRDVWRLLLSCCHPVSREEQWRFPQWTQRSNPTREQEGDGGERVARSQRKKTKLEMWAVNASARGVETNECWQKAIRQIWTCHWRVEPKGKKTERQTGGSCQEEAKIAAWEDQLKQISIVNKRSHGNPEHFHQHFRVSAEAERDKDNHGRVSEIFSGSMASGSYLLWTPLPID